MQVRAHARAHDHVRDHARSHAHELSHADVRSNANALDLNWVAFKALKQV